MLGLESGGEMISLAHQTIAVQVMYQGHQTEDFLKAMSVLFILLPYINLAVLLIKDVCMLCQDIINSALFIINNPALAVVDRIVSISFNAFLPGLG